MNIQIFGTKKCNDTKKAERFFKERGIKYQFIDMKEKGMSKGEFTSVAQVNGGLENMVNWNGKDKDTLALIKYIADEFPSIVCRFRCTHRHRTFPCKRRENARIPFNRSEIYSNRKAARNINAGCFSSPDIRCINLY